MKRILMMVILLLGLALWSQAQEPITANNISEIRLVGMEAGNSLPAFPTTLDSPNGTIQVIVEADGLHVRSGDQEWAVLEGTDFLTFSANGTILASANHDLNQLFFWQVAEANERQILVAGQPPVAFSPDGRFVAYAGDQNEALLAAISDIMSEGANPIRYILEGHFAPVTALAFNSEGDLLATGSQDGSISLWNPSTGEELRILHGHRTGVVSLMFRSGELVSQDRDGNILVWGLGNEITLPEMTSAAATNYPTTMTNGISGTTRQEVMAGYHPMHAVNCVIPETARLLAVGRSDDGALLVYSDYCEGEVWLVARPDNVDWAAPLETLPMVNVPAVEPLMRINNYTSICENATRWDNFSPSQRQRLYPPIALPAEAQATIANGVDLVVCHEYIPLPIENCHYLGPGNYSYIFTRYRTDDQITLVNYATGNIIAQAKFQGGEPPLCPDEVERGEVFGAPPVARIWVPWVLEQAGYPVSAPVKTSTPFATVIVHELPTVNSEEVARLSSFTSLNLIAQDSTGEWGVVLLPDLTKGWVQLDEIEVAFTVHDLPVASGSAANVQIEVN